MTLRSLPSRLVGIVEAMELEQPRVVTLPWLTQIAMDTGAAKSKAQAAKLAYWLQDLGWLGSVRTKGAWEFIPGARAGAIPSGDRFIELRATLAVHPGWPGVLAMESAASVLGLSQHLPEREVVGLPPGMTLPKAMSEWRSVTAAMPAEGVTLRDYLPAWTLEGLIAGIALRPSAYQDLPDLAQWLPDAGRELKQRELFACLAGAPQSAWQRAAYLARLARADAVSDAIVTEHPPQHPIWFGATRHGGLSDPVAKVTDADLAPYLEGGTGA
jgi:hypothetical protein